MFQHLRTTSYLLVTACALTVAPLAAQGGDSSPNDNKLSAAEKQDGWVLLFNGRNLDGWRPYKTDKITGWSVVNGDLVKQTVSGNGDIVYNQPFTNFEFTFDWKIDAKGNSGVFVRATEEYSKIYWSATEYQLLDDAGHPDGANPLTSAGSAYGLYPSIAGTVKPAGQWNSSKIVVRGTKYEHWLNGIKMIEYDSKSPEWVAKVKASKFKDYPNYGLAQSGLIGIQGDHPGTLTLKNLKVHPFPK